MSITQETASLVETLARAASQIGSTDASKKINQLIVDLLPPSTDKSDLIESLRQDNAEIEAELASLQTSARIGAENLEIVRGKLNEISRFTTALLASLIDEYKTLMESDLNTIIDLSKDVDA